MSRDLEILRSHEAVDGAKLRPAQGPQEIWDRLQAGEEDLLLTLIWHPDQADEYHPLFLTRVDADRRVHFYNAMAPEGEPQSGQILIDGAPLRTYHEAGDESVTRDQFFEWFQKRQAVGYLRA